MSKAPPLARLTRWAAASTLHSGSLTFTGLRAASVLTRVSSLSGS